MSKPVILDTQMQDQAQATTHAPTHTLSQVLSYRIETEASDWYDSVHHRRLTVKEMMLIEQASDVVDKALRDRFDAIWRAIRDRDTPLAMQLDDWLHEYVYTLGAMNFLTGQREGFRVAHNLSDLLDKATGEAVTDDERLDQIIGRLVTGLRNPEYIGPDSPVRDRE